MQNTREKIKNDASKSPFFIQSPLPPVAINNAEQAQFKQFQTSSVREPSFSTVNTHRDPSEMHFDRPNQTFESGKELTLENIVVHTTLDDADSVQRGDKILKAFNKGITENWYVYSIYRGVELKADEFALGERNGIPQLVKFHPDYYIATPLVTALGVKKEYKGKFKQDAQYILSNGRFVLNVPQAFLKVENSLIYLTRPVFN